jgi:ATP-dependent Clp protease ATP-binding subunit ClpB
MHNGRKLISRNPKRLISHPLGRKTFFLVVRNKKWTFPWVFGMLSIGGVTYLFGSSVEAESVKVDAKSRSFIFAASKGNLEEIKNMTEKMKENDIKQLVNGRHSAGWTALHAACCNNHLDTVQFLLDHGANINIEDLFDPNSINYSQPSIEIRENEFSKRITPSLSCVGWTPLHYVVAFDNYEIVKYLVSHGADIDKTNKLKHKPEVYIDNSNKESRLIKSFLQDTESKLALEKSKGIRESLREERVRHPLEEKLQRSIVGQVVPILNISSAIRRRENGWHDEDKPLVFLFLGSSGVGKTMLAKCVAENVLGNDPNAFIRIDMSEYSERHEVSKFIGSPPGYVGHEEGGQLTSKLHKFPKAVVLLDEVEKAHADILTIMLQVFDEGRLTDGKGKTVDCRNAMFIMTSNLVQREIGDSEYKLRPTCDSYGKIGAAELALVRSETNQFINKIVHPILKRHFKRDEFLGRINEIIVFHPFVTQDLENIVAKELDKWKTRSLKRQNISLKWTDELVTSLTKDYNENYGFRSIKHEVEKRVINVLASAFENKILVEGNTVTLGLGEDKRTVVLTNIEKSNTE